MLKTAVIIDDINDMLGLNLILHYHLYIHCLRIA